MKEPGKRAPKGIDRLPQATVARFPTFHAKCGRAEFLEGIVGGSFWHLGAGGRLLRRLPKASGLPAAARRRLQKDPLLRGARGGRVVRRDDAIAHPLRITPEQGLLFVENVRDHFSVITLSAAEHFEAVADAGRRGLGGGKIYDLLILKVRAQKRRGTRLHAELGRIHPAGALGT